MVAKDYPKENLLSHEVIKIIYEEGGKYLYSDREEGFERIRQVLASALEDIGSSIDTAKTRDFRKLYHRAWREVIEDLVPYESIEPVSSSFKNLVF